jgi:hypothetical protein
MPKKVEKIVKALKEKGMPKQKAYAVAYSTFNKMKIKKGK